MKFLLLTLLTMPVFAQLGNPRRPHDITTQAQMELIRSIYTAIVIDWADPDTNPSPSAEEVAYARQAIFKIDKSFSIAFEFFVASPKIAIGSDGIIRYKASGNRGNPAAGSDTPANTQQLTSELEAAIAIVIGPSSG